MRMVLFLCALSIPTMTLAKEETSTKKNRASTPPLPMSTVLLYRDYCAHCHGIDGRPRNLVERLMPEIPDFSLVDRKDYDAIDFVESISDGSGQMPAFASILSKDEVNSLSRLLTTFSKGKPNSIIRRRWNYSEQDLKLKEQLQELILD